MPDLSGIWRSYVKNTRTKRWRSWKKGQSNNPASLTIKEKLWLCLGEFSRGLKRTIHMDMHKVINYVLIYSFWAMNQSVSIQALGLFLTVYISNNKLGVGCGRAVRSFVEAFLPHKVEINIRLFVWSNEKWCFVFLLPCPPHLLAAQSQRIWGE